MSHGFVTDSERKYASEVSKDKAGSGAAAAAAWAGGSPSMLKGKDAAAAAAAAPASSSSDAPVLHDELSCTPTSERALCVCDLSGTPVMVLGAGDVADQAHDIAWLKQRICEARGLTVDKSKGEDMLVFKQYGEWMPEGMLLKDSGAHVWFMKHTPPQEPFKLYLFPLATRSQLGEINVTSDMKVKLLKERIQEEMRLVVAELLFCGVKLQAERTVGDYKLLPEAKIDVMLMPK